MHLLMRIARCENWALKDYVIKSITK